MIISSPGHYFQIHIFVDLQTHQQLPQQWLIVQFEWQI